MGKGCAKDQSPYEKSEGVPQTFPVPPGGNFHSQRVDSRQRHAGQETQHNKRRKAARNNKHERVEQRPREAACGEENSRREAVGQSEKRKGQGTGDETEL